MNTPSAIRSRTLTGLHLLLTYECNYECDHCFVWSGPGQSGTMTVEIIQDIIRQAKTLDSIEWIYFEGGEPSLCYKLLCYGVRLAQECGFRVGIVTNASWATTEADAMEWLQPFIGVVEDLSISDDAYHGCDERHRQTHIARQASKRLGIPVDFISVAGVEMSNARDVSGQLPTGKSEVLYRGRAVEKLSMRANLKRWDQFTECPWEELRNPERVHVDTLGNLHVCQGISIGNLTETPLTEIMENYKPDTHPIIGPLLDGGPVELVKRYELPHEKAYADACHLCYISRCKLRSKFPDCLTPDQMYGVS